ncbi:MAG: tetratricopeptide repeat protein, partial [Candidatus Hodarchaeota archaeon]
MTDNTIKELVAQGKVQAVVDQLAQWEADGVFDTFPEQEQIEYIYYQSYAYWWLGQLDKSLQIIFAARQQYTTPSEQSLLLALMTQQIYTLCWMNRLDEAHEVITEGDDILESLTAKERETGAYWIAFFEHRKGDYYFWKKDLNTALKYLQRVLALREKIGDLYTINHSLENLGNYYLLKGELDTALDYYQRALDIAKQMGSNHWIAQSLCNLGAVYYEKRDINTALKYYRRCSALEKEITIPMNSFGTIFLFKGELDIALDYYQRALDIAKQMGSNNLITQSLHNLGSLYYEKQDLNTALEYL